MIMVTKIGCFKLFQNMESKVILQFLLVAAANQKTLSTDANMPKKNGIFTVTFSGFKKKNELSKCGNINFWVNSKRYNHVENSHQIWLLSIIDFIKDNNIKKKK